MFSGLPKRFKDASFSGIRTEGAFLISGNKSNGVVEVITIYSENGGQIRLENPFKTSAFVRETNLTIEPDQLVINITMDAGETVTISKKQNDERNVEFTPYVEQRG